MKKVSIVPLEVIIRNIAAGSFSKRFGVEEGTALKTPSLGIQLQGRRPGRSMINDYHILSLGLATKEELATIAGYAFKVNELLKAFMLKLDIELVDFKLELARRRTARLYWPTKFLLIPAVFGMCIPMRSWIGSFPPQHGRRSRSVSGGHAPPDGRVNHGIRERGEEPRPFRRPPRSGRPSD